MESWKYFGKLFRNNLEIWKKKFGNLEMIGKQYGNLDMIWKFGNNLEMLKSFGNLVKQLEKWKSIKLEKKLEIWKNKIRCLDLTLDCWIK